MTEARNKIAVVTGAGTGVGRAASLALMNAGFTVVLAGRRMEKLQETQKLGDNVGKSLPVSADMTDPGSIAALFAKVMERLRPARRALQQCRHGRAAGAVRGSRACEQWQAVVDVNLTGPFLCTQHAFRIMKAQEPRGGRIINNGSISAHAPRPRLARLHLHQARHHRPDQGDRARRTRLRHRVRPDRHRQRRDHDDRAHGRRRAAARRPRCRSRAWTSNAVGAGGRLHGRPAARRQRAVHDGDGDARCRSSAGADRSLRPQPLMVSRRFSAPSPDDASHRRENHEVTMLPILRDAR